MTREELAKIKGRWESAQSFVGAEGLVAMLSEIPKLIAEVERLQGDLRDAERSVEELDRKYGNLKLGHEEEWREI